MRFNNQIKSSPEIIVIPMIDIMFFLLVFFMLSTMNMTNMSTVPVNLSSMHDTKLISETSLVISIDEQGGIFVGGEKIERAIVGKYAKAALSANPNVLILIRTDMKSTYNDFSDVIESLKQAGVKRVALAAETRY
ncbi:MAG: biopolymer transporter ExbD [Acidaminococcaceae bacterium]|nr:biopolymer transporter ExbD [Acidaminococcaceae bacterium]MDD4721780.1 biopolymer transporter ExbD [Acidaminococcaceae bacterium]